MNTLTYLTKKYNKNNIDKNIIKIRNVEGSLALAELFAALNFNLGAEVGVDRGLFSEILCKANPKLHLHSIDAWSTSAFEDNLNRSDKMQTEMDKHYKDAVGRLSLYNCEVIRKASLDAVKDFADDSLDFVYIDANHDFINFSNDLHYWIKKVRIGGIVSGHDFQDYHFEKSNHVKLALTAYANCYQMTPIFVLITNKKHLKIRRDRSPSWFWVKQ